MRAKLFLIILCCAAWTACQGTDGRSDAHGHAHEAETAAHDHGEHDHEGHSHEAEGHEHDGHDHEGHNHGAEEPEHDAGAAAGEISLPAAKAAAAGVEVGTVTAGPFRDVIVAGGRVMPAPGDETAVVAPVSGVVSFSRPLVAGAQVSKGAPMFTISSERIQDGDAVERARIAYEKARAEYVRDSSLVGDRIVSQKEFEATVERYETARLAYEAIASEEGGGAVVEAPAGGYVKSCPVKEGDYVAVGTPLAVVTQNRRLNLRVDVPERYYPKLADVVSANFRAASGETLHRLSEMNGRMVAYGRNADDASAYIPVTFSFDNAADVVAGSFAEVWLLSSERQGVLSLPVEALTEEQGVYFVYVQLDEDCYRKQAVTTGATDGERVEITAGLADGERVVTRGAIHVKLASASNAIPAHSHNH